MGILGIRSAERGGNQRDLIWSAAPGVQDGAALAVNRASKRHEFCCVKLN